MSYKKNKLNKILKTATFASIFAFVGNIKADALTVEPIYELPGVETGYVDKDVPIALEVTAGEDGIKTGAYLYRHVHEGVDYYAPWTPDRLVGTAADKNKGAYDKWGFWNMNVNKQPHTINAPYYYAKGTVKSGGAKGTRDNGTSAGTLPEGTSIKIYGIQGSNVYVNVNDYSQLTQGSARSDLIRLNKSDITFVGTKMNIMYSGYTDNTLLQNFKKYAKYGDNARATHYGLTTAKWKNPSHDKVPSSVKGLSGEWRYIGYNAFGEPLDNPYFVSENQNFGSTHIYGAVRRHTPWDKTDGGNTGESDPATAYYVFTKGMNSKGLNFPYDTKSKYQDMKKRVVDKLYAEGCIKNTSGVIDQISLRTFADKQGIILKNQRKASVIYSVPFIEGTLRDLYARRMVITDVETGEEIARLNGKVSGSTVEAVGKYTPGKTYEVKIRLANGANAKLIKKSIEVQTGLVYNADSLNSNMSFSKTRKRETMRMGNYAGITKEKGSVSKDFVYRFQVSSTQTGPIDVYGFVGSSHTGVDNLNYDNDVIGIRLTQDTPDNPPGNNPPGNNPPGNNPPGGSTPGGSTPGGSTPGGSTPSCTITNNGKTKTCGGGDIVPTTIELLDENNVVKYKYDATDGVVIRNAIIPGNKYKIRYTSKFVGTTVKRYQWVDAVQDNPNTDADEYVAGYWGPAETVEYKVPLTYTIKRPVKNPITTEIYRYNGDTIYFSKGGSINIPMVANTTMTYTVGAMVMPYPELTTSFKITSTNSRINSDRSNDSLSTSVKDTFDIGVTKLTVKPSITYTDGKAKDVVYNITYDVNLETPSYVTKDDYQAYVNTAININGEVFNVKDQLVKGPNKEITHIITGAQVPALESGVNSKNITIKINVNSDKLSYESGDYTNNKKSTTAVVNKVKNPGDGNPTDTVRPVQNNNNNSSSTGGDANNNCLTPRTKNTWTSTHRKFSWSSTDIRYTTLVTREDATVKKYNIDYYRDDEATVNYNEKFEITEILFKSKETEGKGPGGSDWVNLLKSEEARYAKVKAGYGFELKIVTKYTTNALKAKSWTLSNNGSNGTSVSLLNGGINYGMEDIFLELPGTKGSNGTDGTRKILSSTGYGDSVKGLVVDRAAKNDGSGDVTWTYTIKASNTLGIGETAKIYIPQGMKNGDYKLKIYTAPMQGVGSASKNKYSALCDRKEVIIKVDGAATDDLNSNIIQ